jgi:hypothetical protein
MKTSSCKNKGRLGQQEVVKILLQSFPELVGDDIRSTPMGSQGEDILLSPAARKRIPWNIEVKRGKAFNLVNAVKQAEARNKKEGIVPVAVGRYDRDKKWYATVELNYLLELIK